MNPQRAIQRLAICFILFAAAIRCLGVDPPPPRILRAPVAQQLEYTKEQGLESMRMRSEVAQRRFEEKRHYRATVGVGLERALATERESMVAQENSPGASMSAEGQAEDRDGQRIMSWKAVMLSTLVALIMYGSRGHLVRWWDSRSERRSR